MGPARARDCGNLTQSPAGAGADSRPPVAGARRGGPAPLCPVRRRARACGDMARAAVRRDACAALLQTLISRPTRQAAGVPGYPSRAGYLSGMGPGPAVTVPVTVDQVPGPAPQVRVLLVTESS